MVKCVKSLVQNNGSNYGNICKGIKAHDKPNPIPNAANALAINRHRFVC